MQIFVSDDNGSNWTPMEGKYTHPGNSNQAFGEPLYDGLQSTWVKEEINLEPYLDKQIIIRFVLKSDSYVVGDGFFMDDMTVTMVDLVTGVGQNSPVAMQEISVYPNPTREIATFNYKIDRSSSCSKILKIFNLTGQKIYENELPNNSGKISVDVSSWPSGMYFYSLSNDQAVIASGKLIVK